MSPTYVALLIFHIEYDICFAYLSSNEENITLSLMKVLEIQHWILVEENPENIIHNFKSSSTWNKPMAYLSINEFFQYFQKEIFPFVQTMIVFKTDELMVVTEFLKELGTEFNNCYKFTWLVLVSLKNLTSLDTSQLRVPYNCEFIIAHTTNLNNYKLTEVYKLKDKTISFDYGVWDYRLGLITTNLTFYWRRLNLNHTELNLETSIARGVSIQQINLKIFALVIHYTYNFFNILETLQ